MAKNQRYGSAFDYLPNTSAYRYCSETAHRPPTTQSHTQTLSCTALRLLQISPTHALATVHRPSFSIDNTDFLQSTSQTIRTPQKPLKDHSPRDATDNSCRDLHNLSSPPFYPALLPALSSAHPNQAAQKRLPTHSSRHPPNFSRCQPTFAPSSSTGHRDPTHSSDPHTK